MTQRRINQNRFPYFVTTNTINGEWWFEDDTYAQLLSEEIFVSAKIKGFNVLSYQIMPNHLHILVYQNGNRTLEKVRFGQVDNVFLLDERTLSSVRSTKNEEYTISDLMQSIKGNFSRKVHMGNIWQRRFYAEVIDSGQHFQGVINYIKSNPIKDDLPRKYHKMPYQFIL